MSVESEILRIQHNIADAYTKVAEKGGEVPLQPNSANLAASIETIIGGGSSSGVPIGAIVIWSGTTADIPTGWALCDGQDGRPDLRDKFVLGAGTSHAVGNTGGSEEVTLTIQQMPSHGHRVIGVGGTGNNYGFNASIVANLGGGQWASTTYAGNGEAHSNMPPYYVLCYIIKVTADETGGGASLTAGDGLSKEGDTLSVTTPVRSIVTQAEFDALPEAERNKGLYVISDGGSGGSGESAGEVYSTEEIRIGTWIDGKPIYRICFQGNAGAVNKNTSIFNMSEYDVDAIINLYGSIFRTDSSPGQISLNAHGNNWYSLTQYLATTKSIINIVTSSVFENCKVVGTVEYTKTTDEGGTS